MTRIRFDWPKLVFIFVPLAIVIVDVAVLEIERRQPDTAKAIRLVKESNSRKENFTVQQYLYATLYHRINKGESIVIEGWEAFTTVPAGMTVEFRYSDTTGPHAANWQADLQGGTVTATNETAVQMSWH